MRCRRKGIKFPIHYNVAWGKFVSKSQFCWNGSALQHFSAGYTHLWFYLRHFLSLGGMLANEQHPRLRNIRDIGSWMDEDVQNVFAHVFC